MILLFFGIMWAILLVFTLTAPFIYYPIIIIAFLLSLIGFPLMQTIIKTEKARNYVLYPLMAVAFIAAFVITSWFIFKPAKSATPKIGPVDSSRKAVIFFCQGEMEEYTPSYSKKLLEKYPYILKPMKAFQLKRLYKKAGGSSKNLSLIKVASEVKNSLLNNGPYYYYIAFSDYYPSIETSLSQAIEDGCGDITIINYTSSYELNEKNSSSLSLDSLKSQGIDVRVSLPVCSSQAFQQVFLSRIINMPEKYDGILLIGKFNPFSTSLQSMLIENGYSSKQIIVTESLREGLDYFSNNDCSDVLYVDLNQSGDGIVSQALIPQEISRYNPSFSVKGIRDWGYDIGFVRASIEVFTACQNK